MAILRPSQSRVFAVILWLFTLQILGESKLLEGNGWLWSIVKALGYMVTMIVTTAVLEMTILGPLPEEKEDE